MRRERTFEITLRTAEEAVRPERGRQVEEYKYHGNQECLRRK